MEGCDEVAWLAERLNEEEEAQEEEEGGGGGGYGYYLVRWGGLLDDVRRSIDCGADL